jgi:hypothetical protein
MNNGSPDFRNFVPGKPIGMSRSDFTQDVQENIMRSAVGIHAGVSQFPSPEAPGQVQNPASSSPTSDEITISRSEYDEMKRAREFLNSEDARTAFNRQYTPQTYTPPQPQTSQPPAQAGQMAAPTGKQEAGGDTDWLENLFGSNTQEPTTQPPAATAQPSQTQTQDQPPQPQETPAFMQEISNASIPRGVNPNEVKRFVESITPNDYVELYLALQNQMRQQKPPTTPPPQPTNLAEISRPGPVVRPGQGSVVGRNPNAPRNPFS